ncbi:MAG: S1/P1 nuclease [Phycisphaerae bacterium]|nr:S1/P1 nuclease [Phycisphaerae bacterium]
MIVRVLRRLAVALLAFSPLVLGGWGEAGHRIVGQIAYNRLSPTAKAEIDAILASEHTDLPTAAYWPDAVARSQAKYRFANQLHYANVPRGSAEYVPARDRPEGGDIVSGIDDFAKVLADKTQPVEKRLEALRFLAHFVGDIHQPLHVGYKEDRGGNDINVRFYNRRMKLHAVWDTGLLEKSGIDWQEYATDLDAKIRPQDVVAYTERMTPLEWAQETYQLAIREGYGNIQQDDAIARPYVDEKLPVVEDQLSIAGVRLATLINSMFGGTAPTPPQTVYVTTSGKRYHVAGCRFLAGPHTPLTLEEAKRTKTPCTFCDPPR